MKYWSDALDLAEAQMARPATDDVVTCCACPRVDLADRSNTGRNSTSRDLRLGGLRQNFVLKQSIAIAPRSRYALVALDLQLQRSVIAAQSESLSCAESHFAAAPCGHDPPCPAPGRSDAGRPAPVGTPGPGRRIERRGNRRREVGPQFRRWGKRRHRFGLGGGLIGRGQSREGAPTIPSVRTNPGGDQGRGAGSRSHAPEPTRRLDGIRGGLSQLAAFHPRPRLTNHQLS